MNLLQVRWSTHNHITQNWFCARHPSSSSSLFTAQPLNNHKLDEAEPMMLVMRRESLKKGHKGEEEEKGSNNTGMKQRRCSVGREGTSAGSGCAVKRHVCEYRVKAEPRSSNKESFVMEQSFPARLKAAISAGTVREISFQGS